MPAQIKIKGFSGSPKKITVANLFAQMDAASAWFSSNASIVSVDDILPNSDRHWIIMEAGSYLDIEFTADVNGNDGQGFVIPDYFKICSVTGLSQTAKYLSIQYSTFGMTRQDAYNHGNAVNVSVNDSIPPGSFLVCSRNASLTLRCTVTNIQVVPLIMVPLVSLFFCTS